MNQPDLVVRPLTADDLPALLPIHRQAFAGTLGVMLGRRYLDAFLRWFITYPDAVCLGCTVDDQLAGYVFGAPVGYGTRLNRDLLGDIVLAIVTHGWVVFHPTFMMKIGPRLRSLLGRSSAPPAPATAAAAPPVRAFSLVGIGVGTQFRRQGVASAVSQAFEQAVWARGFEELRLSVYHHNAAARQFYDATGWSVRDNDGRVITYARQRPDPAG